MLELIDVYRISIQGKLKGYTLSPLYITVYYTHTELEKNQYYVFKFTTSNQKLIDATIETRIMHPPYKQHGKEYDLATSIVFLSKDLRYTVDFIKSVSYKI